MKHALFAVAIAAASIAVADADEPPLLDKVLAVDGSSGREIAVSFEDETRRRAMATAARAFGAQAGLQRRGWEISQVLARYAPQLNRIYRFRDLMIREAGFMVQPPVLAETRDAFILARSGAQAASAGRVVKIVAREKIVSSVPAWRDFLVRDWPEPETLATILFPRTPAENALWEEGVREGWGSGYRLAGEIFADDLNRLNSIFTGLILWHHMRLAGMVTAPDVGTREVAVAGGGTTLRIAERFVAIDQAAALVADPGQWRPLVGQ